MLPAASAGATFHEAISSGKFQGTIRPDDPERLAERHVDAARRPGSCRRAGARARRRSSGRSRTTIPISPRASEIGLPAFRASSVASSSACSSSASARRRSSAARSRRRHGPPGAERRLRPRHRRVRLLGARPRHLRHHLLGCGLDDLDHFDPHLGSRRLHQRSDHAAFGVLLGVPEDAEGERMVRQLDRLDHLVADRPARGDQSLAQLVHALMMMRLDHEPLGSRRPGGERARLKAHLVVAERARRVAMSVRLVEVLDERASQRHVQDLHAPADAEQRDLAVERPAEQRHLEAVALGPGAAGLGMRGPRRRWQGRRRRPPASIRASTRSRSGSGAPTAASSGGMIKARPPAR